MILSMTGFAAAAADLPGVSLAVELRSVNHRFLDVSLRLPDEVRTIEPAVREALAGAGVGPDSIGSWDLHATATPGDYSEMTTLRSLFPETLLVTARKGTFGHGMSAGGGWELTAQYLGYAEGRLFPTPLSRDELNGAIAKMHQNFVFNTGCDVPAGLSGKLSMGIGGINACVISRPL